MWLLNNFIVFLLLRRFLDLLLLFLLFLFLLILIVLIRIPRMLLIILLPLSFLIIHLLLIILVGIWMHLLLHWFSKRTVVPILSLSSLILGKRIWFCIWWLSGLLFWLILGLMVFLRLAFLLKRGEQLCGGILLRIGSGFVNAGISSFSFSMFFSFKIYNLQFSLKILKNVKIKRILKSKLNFNI